MASQTAPPSRLMFMQMKFQQKQLQEREQKKSEIFSAMSKNNNNETTIPNSLMGNGKVRAMFDERRRGAGIDRSQPLKPITASGANAGVVKRISNSTLRNNGINTAPSKTNSVKTSNKEPMKRATGGRDIIQTVADLTLNNDVTDSRRNSTETKESDQYNNNNIHLEKPRSPISNKRTPVITGNGKMSAKPSIALGPVHTKKPVPPALSPLNNISKGLSVKKAASPVRDVTRSTEKTKITKKIPPAKLTQSIAQMNQAPREITPPPGMLQCHYCHRNFLEERLPKHEAVCAKLSTAKRKVFDASQHRVRGTEAEKYVKKTMRSQHQVSAKTQASSTRAGANSGLKKNNWRKKHEEFIAAIRAAKEMQAHLARGGKMSDLPPLPPTENPDYIQCPHCGRRFNEAAADRHIPKCANMLHNKPKPGAATRASLTKRR